MKKLYVDMDGVLADFDTGYEMAFGYRPSREADNADWSLIRAAKDFYLNLPPMPDMPVLWEAIKQHDPTVLTGVPDSVPEALANKQAWRDRWLGYNVPLIGCPSKSKCLYAVPGDILIDDWKRYRHLWEAEGGTFVLHTSAADTVEQLQRMGAIPS